MPRDENDDFYREEGIWQNPECHRRLLSEKIEELQSALSLAMARIEQAKSMGCDVTDARFYDIVHTAQRMEEDL